MKISLKLANGSTLEFDGDAAEFERISEFLAEPPESLTAGSSSGGSEPAPSTLPGPQNGVQGPSVPDGPSLDPATVSARLEQVGAANDQERVTVIAQLAVESGKDGIDYDALNSLYTELGFRKPAQFPAKTFSNAKGSGLVKPVKPGVWRPTYRGENFARGFGRGERQVRRAPTRPPSLLDSEGGESD
jgi:hypothetical protein